MSKVKTDTFFCQNNFFESSMSSQERLFLLFNSIILDENDYFSFVVPQHTIKEKTFFRSNQQKLSKI